MLKDLLIDAKKVTNVNEAVLLECARIAARAVGDEGPKPQQLRLTTGRAAGLASRLLEAWDRSAE